MNRITFAMVAAVGGMLVAAPQGAEAQSDRGWWEWALVEVMDRAGPDGGWDRRGRVENDRVERRGRVERDRGPARGQAGPPFCRNGQGHPVHGPEWCREKGFGSGAGGLGDIRWEDRGWEDIILGTPRGGERRRTVDEGGLIDILGDIVLGRVERERQRIGGTSPLEGRWVQLRGGGRVLQIRSGGVPVAELSDVDGDGRVDASLVPRPRQ